MICSVPLWCAVVATITAGTSMRDESWWLLWGSAVVVMFKWVTGDWAAAACRRTRACTSFSKETSSSSLNFLASKQVACCPPFASARRFEMTFCLVFWTDFLMVHEMCRLAVLVLFHCSVLRAWTGLLLCHIYETQTVYSKRKDLLCSSHGNRSANVTSSDSYFMSELKCLAHPSCQL